jgi:hypothetical protein
MGPGAPTEKRTRGEEAGERVAELCCDGSLLADGLGGAKRLHRTL